VTLQSEASNAVAVLSLYAGATAIGRTARVSTSGIGGACVGGTDRATVDAELPPPAPRAGALLLGALALRNRTLTAQSPGVVRRQTVQRGEDGDVAGLVVAELTSASFQGTLSGATDWAIAITELLP
jgi:hypothetical protein